MIEMDDIKAQWARQRPDLDTEPMEVIGRLIRLASVLSDEMNETFKVHGLTAGSFDVLATLLRSGPPHALSPNQLLDTMMVTSGTMTNRIDQLEKEKLVKRVRNPKDRRSVMVQLTETGRRLIDAAITDHVETQARLVKGMSKEQRVNLNLHLETFFSTLHKESGNGE